MDIRAKVKYLHFLEAAEAFGADEVQNVVLYETHGHGTESFVAQPTEDTAQFTYQGQLESERTTKSYLGQVAFPAAIGGAAESIERNVVGTALFSFDTGTTDSEVRKVDSSISVDRDDVAFNAFVKQTEDVARTILFDITNSAETVLNTLKVYDGAGSTALSGAYSELKFTAAHVGLGGLAKHGVAVKKQVFGYVGEGSLNTLTGRTPKVSRENLLRERFFTPRLVLHRSESRATLSTQAQEHSYQQEQQQKPDMFPSTPLLEQSLFLENSLIQRFDTFPQLQLVDYRQYLELQQLRTLSYHLHLVVSSVLDLETKHTQEILMSVSEV